MAFEDALQDSATFFARSYTTDPNNGQQTPVEILIFGGPIKCRLHSRGSANGEDRTIRESDAVRDSWILQVKPEFSTANRKDRVIVNGDNYLITKRHIIKGDNPNANHVIYFIKEQD